MPKKLVKWLGRRLSIGKQDVYPTDGLLGPRDLLQLSTPERADLHFPPHLPEAHPRLRHLEPDEPQAIFSEIDRGDILLHHPYHDYDGSVLRFLQSAAIDPAVLAIKLTIYRTSSASPIVRALIEAARRGKQVAVLVEITARFDEEPNIAWGRLLEREGVHVSYGVERLKTHVKLALVVREEQQLIRRYVHTGTGNYHTGTARIYEDLGLLTCHADICEDVAALFNALTGAAPMTEFRRLLVAPHALRARFTEMIRREAGHAAAGRPAGIRAKMNQLQDPDLIRELYRAGQAGVRITLIVRGLCCLRPGVPGLSENIGVSSIVGRFLEHSRVYRFENGGEPEYFLGSADWMKRNLDRRVESVVPILDPAIQRQIDAIFDVYEADNGSAWDCASDGTYVPRIPRPDEDRLAAQDAFIERASHDAHAIERGDIPLPPFGESG